MEQHSERLGPRSDDEPQIQAPGDLGDAAEAGAWDVEDDAGVVAWDVDDDAGAEAWDGQEDAETVAWDEGEAGALDPDGPGQRPATGEPRVDAALARLDELPGRPVTEHRAVFEDVHRRLRDVLGELDTREQGSGDQAAAAGAERRAGR